MPLWVRSNVRDSVKDYADLFEEMGVPASAHEKVFEIITDYRDRKNNSNRIGLGTTSSLNYANRYFFSGVKITSLASIDGMSGLFKDLVDEEKKKDALARLLPIFSRLWTRMRYTVFEQPTTRASPAETSAEKREEQPAKGSRKRSASHLALGS